MLFAILGSADMMLKHTADHTPISQMPWAVAAALVFILSALAQFSTNLSLSSYTRHSDLFGKTLMSGLIGIVVFALVELAANLDMLVSLLAGLISGFLPPLHTLIAGLRFIGKKYGIDVTDIADELYKNGNLDVKDKTKTPEAQPVPIQKPEKESEIA